MKTGIITTLLIALSLSSIAQLTTPRKHMLMLSEDNDYFNYKGDGTDKDYTHGFRAEYNYVADDTTHHYLFSRLFLKAGASAVNTYGWNITQMMITPSDLDKSYSDINDYRYACSLTLGRSLHSSNAVKHYNVQSEVYVGFIGPEAFGKETQNGIHKLIHNAQAKGWASEYNTALLVNASMAVEKQIWNPVRSIEVIGGGKASAGTALNAVSVYSIIRIGKMTPYFNGLISQRLSDKHSHSWQIYQTLKPSIDIIGYNTLVQGSMLIDRPAKREGASNNFNTSRDVKRIETSFDYTIFMSTGGFAISFTQRFMDAMIKQQDRHPVGNVSLHFAI